MYSFKNSLSFLVFKKIFVWYFFIATIFTIYEIYMQYKIVNNNIIKELNIAKNSFEKILQTSIWNLDIKKINEDIKAILNSNNIIGISIKSLDEEIISRIGVLPFEEKKYTLYLLKNKEEVIFNDSLEKFTFFIENSKKLGEKKLAVVDFYYSKDTPYEMIKENIFLIVAITFLKLFVLFLLFNYFLKKIITKPLKNLIEATRHLDGRNRVFVDTNIKNNYHTELNVLTDSFNYMSKKIYEDFESLTKLNVILKKQKKELLEAYEYKNFFLANISHELKTPLNPISLISSTMIKNKENKYDEVTIENLKIINKASAELKLLIEDILDLIKIEAGEVKANFEEVDLQVLFNILISSYKEVINEKSLELNYNVQLSNSKQIINVRRFNQVCRNLISNAIKFTKEGSINITLKDDKNNIYFEVIDTGIGIDFKDIDKIFTTFKQLDASTIRKFNGMGVGLAISKELAKLLEGDIKVSSQKDAGSTFTFFFKKQDKSKIGIKKQEENLELCSFSLENKNQNNPCIKIKVFILNDNPLLFFKLGVALNKQTFINLEQIKSLDELGSFEDRIYLIIQAQENKKLEEIKQINKNLKIIALGNIESNLYDKLFEFPFENESLIEYIKEDYKKN
ncbi:HAMP domain-containing sensor histidine kinase [Malaciobacter mytili]|uniref:sensor histidine kinase n=1 Tax=Malaciobacter mytili TaxID=603050 RepID=UPI003BB2235F